MCVRNRKTIISAKILIKKQCSDFIYDFIKKRNGRKMIDSEKLYLIHF